MIGRQLGAELLPPQIASLIGSTAAKRLKLKKGSKATAIIKATEVIIATDDR